MGLTGKSAIVTGAGKGIGRAIALAFAKEGVKVAVVARTRADIEAVAQEIRSAGGEAIAVQADMANEGDVARMVEEAEQRFGRIDILVNNAAVNLPYTRLLEVSASEWNRVLAVNLTGAFLAMKAVLPAMIAQRSGKIINIGSVGARHGAAGRGPYRASKAALLSLTESAAAEVKPFGIDVNAICPGPTDTPMQREMRRGKLPAGLMAPEEIAAVAVFLASDRASGITGTAIEVFGPGNPLFGAIPPPQPAGE
ncbi:MAG: SDR family oxidoreductase [Betaproteobacteria bacterium]|nr:SDR family oxidoreductase [Betaproteobacteria bacterium]